MLHKKQVGTDKQKKTSKEQVGMDKQKKTSKEAWGNIIYDLGEVLAGYITDP